MAIFRELATQTATIDLVEFNDVFMGHMLQLTKYGRDRLTETHLPLRLKIWS